MNKKDFPTSRDEVIETLIELETLSNLTLDGTKTSNKLPSVLIKQKSISRDEAKRMFKCKFCQFDGHFEVDCRKRTIAVTRIKLLKTRTPRHQSQCSSSSQVLQLQPTLIPKMSPMNLEHMSLMRSSQAFLLHLKEAHMQRPTLFLTTTRFLD